MSEECCGDIEEKPAGGEGTCCRDEDSERSGFGVRYGPVRSEDLPRYLDNGCEADEGMRKVRFGLKERLAVVPIEVKGGLKYILVLSVLLALLAGFEGGGYSAAVAWSALPSAAGISLMGFLGGTVLVPLLLPWLPGRAFAGKGAVAGGLLAGVALSMDIVPPGGWIRTGGVAMLLITLARIFHKPQTLIVLKKATSAEVNRKVTDRFITTGCF